MTDLFRTRVAWTGFPGGPGVSTFYGLVSGAILTPLHAFLTSVATDLPSDVTMQIESSGDVIDDATGNLTGAWSDSPVAAIGGVVPGAYAAPAGFQVKWLTDVVADGKRLRGRTFFVPASAGLYEDGGEMLVASTNVLQGFANTFVAAETGDLVVWHRPRVAVAAHDGLPAITARAGSHGLVTACSVPQKLVVLRSRRD